MESRKFLNETHQHHHPHHHHNVHSSDRQHHHNSTLSFTSILIIIISIITIVVFFAILVIIVMLRRIKNSENYNSSSQEIGRVKYPSNRFHCHTTIDFNCSPDSADVKGGCFIGGNIKNAPLIKFKGVQVFTYKELEAATDKFSEANVMGNGGFGVVYRGVLIDGTIAAIKKLHREGKQGERAFRVEVDLLSRLYSPYLVELLGYCADQHHRLLVFEYMPNGTLQNHLHRQSNEQPPLDWGTRLRIALDCAKALEFLHEYATPPVIHRDFKCSNIFLDHNLRAKVSDFMLAKMGSDKINGQTQTSTRVLGTTGYLAPEYLSTGSVTTKSDVYSYGVVLLQLLTGRVPVDNNRPPGEHVLVSWALPRLTNREQVEKMIDPALKGQYSMKDLIQIAAIAAVCVQPEADYRPLMTDVVQSLIPLVKNHTSLSYSGSIKVHHQISSPKC